MKNIIPSYYDSRETRNQFVADHLSKYIGESVLNIGGSGKHYLAKFLTENVEYKELDIAGTPDYKVNLEKEVPLDIVNNSFETVICTEVLEHLDNFHEVYFELIRIASKWVIISLPNALHGVDTFMAKEHGYQSKKAGLTRGLNMKFYGLPAYKPEDRHKWFFSYSEAKFFLEFYAQDIGFEVSAMFPVGSQETSRRKMLETAIFRLILNEKRFIDKYASSIWCVMDVSNKKSSEEINAVLSKALSYSN